MASKYFRAGSPFELIMTNEIVEQHAVIKEEVLKVLDKLSDEAENITLHHIEQEMNEHWWSGLGRAVVVVGGVISLALLWCPVASAAVGIGTCVVGYAIVGKSIYECRANSKKRIQQMQKIYEEVKVQLERYEVSTQTVFTDLGSYGFSQGKDVKENMEKMENMIKNAEKQIRYGCCNELENLLKKVKTNFLEHQNQQKETLGSEEFQMDRNYVMAVACADVACADDVAAVYCAGAVGSVIGIWVQEVNILINGCFLIKDVWEYIKLKIMKDEWNNGDKEHIKKEEKFKVYLDLKNEILEITKKMRSYGY